MQQLAIGFEVFTAVIMKSTKVAIWEGVARTTSDYIPLFTSLNWFNNFGSRFINLGGYESFHFSFNHLGSTQCSPVDFHQCFRLMYCLVFLASP